MLRQLARSPPSKDARSISLLTEAVSFLVGERAFWRSIPHSKRRTKFMRQWPTLILLVVVGAVAGVVAVAAAATVAALAAVRRGVCCICNCSGLWNLRRHECLQLGNVVVLIGCKPFVSSPLFCQQREPGREVSSGGWCNAHELDTAPTSA